MHDVRGDQRSAPPVAPGAVAAPVVDIAIPVYNEEQALGPSVERLHAYLSGGFPFSWRITIVDNGSTDGTWLAATRLARDLPNVTARHLDRKGRGLALRTAWSATDATVVAYMDVDLSTDLDALLPLVAPLVSGHSDLAIGSRLAPGARRSRGRRERELISRTYNLILRTVLATRVRDAQCGFKAVRADVAARLAPRGRGRRLVLRHRAPAARRAQRPAHPRGPGRLGRRRRQPRARRPHRVRRPASARRGCSARSRPAGGRLELGPSARRPLDDDFGRRLVSFAAIGAAEHARVARAVPADVERARARSARTRSR